MKKFEYRRLHNYRRQFINANKEEDHILIKGNNKVILSAPHGVNQIRLGKLKYKEVGSLATALFLQAKTSSYLIAKTKNNNDDANFDEASDYRKTLCKTIENNGIKYLIDFHGLSPKRECDVNLGIHLGKNIETNEDIFKSLYDSLQFKGFNVSVDMPFMGGHCTISGAMKNKYPDMWTIQIEVNSSISNREKNSNKYQSLLDALEQWIKDLP